MIVKCYFVTETMKTQTSLISFMYDLYSMKVQQHLYKVFHEYSGCEDMDILLKGNRGYKIEHKGSRKKEWIYVTHNGKIVGEVMVNEIRFKPGNNEMVLVTKYTEGVEYEKGHTA